MTTGNNNHNNPVMLNFDVVPEASDHHFLQTSRADGLFQDCNSSVCRAIMKEWKSLRKDLPESIFVQAYETRMDLLRACIIGPPDTPYHHGLFFFDICLPSDYPHNPPKVHYRSHGYRVNPNLYSNGTVCLSLINTWSGSRDEKWTRNSTILQTLVSIQGLVLNERPYFNEPYYSSGKNSKSATVISRSINYNQTAFILSCKTMLALARNPPRNFEVFVAQHFRARAGLVLASVREYEDRVRAVGWFGTHAGTPEEADVKFKASQARQVEADLKQIRSGLLIAFRTMISPEQAKLYGGDRAKQNVKEVEKDKGKKKKKGVFSKFLGWVAQSIWKKQ